MEPQEVLDRRINDLEKKLAADDTFEYQKELGDQLIRCIEIQLKIGGYIS